MVCTWFGSLHHRPVVDLVLKLGSVVIHVDDEDVEVHGLLHLIPVHIDRMSAKLFEAKITICSDRRST